MLHNLKSMSAKELREVVREQIKHGQELEAKNKRLQSKVERLKGQASSIRECYANGDKYYFVDDIPTLIKRAEAAEAEVERLKSDRDQQYDMKVKARNQRDHQYNLKIIARNQRDEAVKLRTAAEQRADELERERGEANQALAAMFWFFDADGSQFPKACKAACARGKEQQIVGTQRVLDCREIELSQGDIDTIKLIQKQLKSQGE